MAVGWVSSAMASRGVLADVGKVPFVAGYLKFNGGGSSMNGIWGKRASSGSAICADLFCSMMYATTTGSQL